MAIIKVAVPDIGDFADVPVIEVLVKPGDTIRSEQALVTLESDKATLDVPSPVDGVVTAIGVERRRQGVRGQLPAGRGGGCRSGRGRTAPEGVGRRAHHRQRGAAGRLRHRRRLRDDRRAGARYRRLQGHAGDRGAGEGGRHGQGRGPADHAGIRQGHDGRAGACRRHHRHRLRQGWRQGVGGQPDPDAVHRRFDCSPGGGPSGAGAGPERGGVRRRGGYRVRDAGARRWAGRLFGGVPFG